MDSMGIMQTLALGLDIGLAWHAWKGREPALAFVMAHIAVIQLVEILARLITS